MLGIGANLGSSLTVEMIGAAGFDWTWIDCEHGAGDYSELIPQIQAASIPTHISKVRKYFRPTPTSARNSAQASDALLTFHSMAKGDSLVGMPWDTPILIKECVCFQVVILLPNFYERRSSA